MLSIDKKSGVHHESTRSPKHQNVLIALENAIDQGQYVPGDRLPDERQLAIKFSVSRNTIRQALAHLHTAGRVERRQGSGTYIAGSSSAHVRPSNHVSRSKALSVKSITRQMISILVVGPFACYSSYINAILACSQKILGEKDMNLVVHYVQQSADLPKAIQTTSNDPSTLGGLILGDVHEADAALLVDNCIPWVVIGDFLDASRTGPIVDQVTGDNYHLAELSTQALLEQGVKRPALLTSTPGIWQEEKISAFRTACQSAGIDPADQIIASLFPQDYVHENVNAYNQAVFLRTAQIIAQWTQTNHWPDGIVLPGQALLAWLEQLRTHPVAWKKLRNCPIIAMDPELHSHKLSGSLDLPGLKWSEIATADIAAQAIYRLLVNPRLGRSPVRDYIRKLRIVPNIE